MNLTMPETSKDKDLQKFLAGILLGMWNIRTIKNGNLSLLSKSFCKEILVSMSISKNDVWFS